MRLLQKLSVLNEPWQISNVTLFFYLIGLYLSNSHKHILHSDIYEYGNVIWRDNLAKFA